MSLLNNIIGFWKAVLHESLQECILWGKQYKYIFLLAFFSLIETIRFQMFALTSLKRIVVENRLFHSENFDSAEVYKNSDLRFWSSSWLRMDAQERRRWENLKRLYFSRENEKGRGLHRLKNLLKLNPQAPPLHFYTWWFSSDLISTKSIILIWRQRLNLGRVIALRGLCEI